jgi:hypothetical protein
MKKLKCGELVGGEEEKEAKSPSCCGEKIRLRELSFVEKVAHNKISFFFGKNFFFSLVSRKSIDYCETE